MVCLPTIHRLLAGVFPSLPYLTHGGALADECFDIIIWSATSMRWVEVKMKELGCLDHPAFK